MKIARMLKANERILHELKKALNELSREAVRKEKLYYHKSTRAESLLQSKTSSLSAFAAKN